jgi:hypothetical protein
LRVVEGPRSSASLRIAKESNPACCRVKGRCSGTRLAAVVAECPSQKTAASKSTRRSTVV